MDIGFEGDFLCHANSINKEIHPDWIAEEKGNWVRVKPTMFDTVFANDIRTHAKIAWVSYFQKRMSNANEIYHLGSIVDLVKRAKAGEDVFPHNIDVVTGGFPCQDFSLSGKRQGFNSDKSHLGVMLDHDEPSVERRGQLYMWMRDVITLTAPKLFVAENVRGLTNLGHVKDIIEHDFASAGDGGYLVVPAKLLFAPDYGVPQTRERVIFFGFKKSSLTQEALAALSRDDIPEAFDPYPTRTHGEGLLPYVTCADVLADLPEPNESTDPSQRKYSGAKYLGYQWQGQIEIKWDSVAPTIRSEHHGNIEYRRLSEEHGGKHFDELKAGLPERRLTVRECARLQTFPDDYQFIIPRTKQSKSIACSDAYRLIGNAVPCVLAYHIAKNLESKWHKYFGEK